MKRNKFLDIPLFSYVPKYIFMEEDFELQYPIYSDRLVVLPVNFGYQFSKKYLN